VENFVGMNQTGNNDRPLDQVQDAADGIGQPTQEYRHDEKEAKSPHQEECGDDPEPTQRHVKQQTEAPSQVVKEYRFERDARYGCDPDEGKGPPTKGAAKGYAMRGGKRAGNQAEDRGVIQSGHDPVSGAIVIQHVIHAAHGEEQDAGDDVNAEQELTRSITLPPPHHKATQNQKYQGSDQMADGAHRFVKARKVVQLGRHERGSVMIGRCDGNEAYAWSGIFFGLELKRMFNSIVTCRAPEPSMCHSALPENLLSCMSIARKGLISGVLTASRSFLGTLSILRVNCIGR